MGLLALSQVWQVEEDHDISQRITLAALGSVVGMSAYLLHQYLMLDTQFELIEMWRQHSYPNGSYLRIHPPSWRLYRIFLCCFSLLIGIA